MCATRIKLDAILEIADRFGVQIIALQETKLKDSSCLKLKGFHILRSDRQHKGGGGLAFLIRDVNYQQIHPSPMANSDLEIQGMKVLWKSKCLNIYNLYHPPNQKSIPGVLFTSCDSNTVVMGDLNAKHTAWGSTTVNHRGEALLHIMDDCALMPLNDGTKTHASFSYNTYDVLDVTAVSSDIYPDCSWTVLHNIGSDHLPILLEIKRRRKKLENTIKFCNFKKADWVNFRSIIDQELSFKLSDRNLDEKWSTFKKTVLQAAKQVIPRGSFKNPTPFYMHRSPLIGPLLEKRDHLISILKNTKDPFLKVELSKTNAEIKSTYALIKRQSWSKLCENIDARTPNTKFWKLVQTLSTKQPQQKVSNSISDDKEQVAPTNKTAANLLD